VNSLPKTVTRQRRGCDLNPGPTATESITLTTRLPSHHDSNSEELIEKKLFYSSRMGFCLAVNCVVTKNDRCFLETAKFELIFLNKCKCNVINRVYMVHVGGVAQW